MKEKGVPYNETIDQPLWLLLECTVIGKLLSFFKSLLIVIALVLLHSCCNCNFPIPLFLFHFIHLPLSLSLSLTHAHTCSSAATPPRLPGVRAAVREVVLDSQLQLSEQTVGEREREYGFLADIGTLQQNINNTSATSFHL